MAHIEYLFPEMILGSSVFLMLLVFSLIRRRQSAVGSIFTLLSLASALYVLIHFCDMPPALLFASHFIFDSFACIFKILSVIVAGFLILFDYQMKRNTAEYYILILISVIGIFISASAADMITFAIGIEMVSVPMYFILLHSLRQTQRKIVLKYFVYGGIGLASLLFGSALLYITTGKTNLYEIHRILEYASPVSLVFPLSVLFICAGIGFKIGIMPFHFWYPDAVEKAYTPISAYIAHAPFLAGIPFLIRVLFLVCSEPDVFAGHTWIPALMPEWPSLLKVLSSITVIAASAAMLNQKNIKRFIAYSSLFHIGCSFLGLLTATGFGVKAFLIYIMVFITANLGLFSVAGEWTRLKNTELIENMRGMGRISFFYGFAIAVFLLSLSGFPLFAGFVGTFYILSSLIEVQYYWLTGVAIMGNLLAFFAYIRLIYIVFAENGAEAAMSGNYSLPNRVISAVMLLPTLYFGLNWDPLIVWIANSSQILLFPQRLIGGF